LIKTTNELKKKHANSPNNNCHHLGLLSALASVWMGAEVVAAKVDRGYGGHGWAVLSWQVDVGWGHCLCCCEHQESGLGAR
jgi:hypothetical protein